VKGPVFGRYDVELKLASGGMGEVYLAREDSTDQLVILKVLRRDLIRDQQVVLQFLDEVRISAQLHHPNVVSVFDVGDWHDEIVMAMEYIPGHDCATLLKTAQSRQITELPVPVAAQILIDAAEGLDYVHKAADLRGNPLKVVHRDISPQNLMVREDGLTKILDFGVARAEARIVRTMQGVVKGKLSYMAPEQIRGTEITGKVDQFSLGVVAWELLTVQRLFRGTNDVETLNLVMEKPVLPPSHLSRDVPVGLDRVILKMLERNPEHRYANCGEAAKALAPFAVGRSAVVKFRKDLGLENPSERYKDKSVITEGRGHPSPLASPGAPPRASPGTTRQRSARPRSVPPTPAIPSADLATNSQGTEEHDAMREQRGTAPELPRVGSRPVTREGRRITGNAMAAVRPEDDDADDMKTQGPTQFGNFGPNAKTFIATPSVSRATTDREQARALGPESITDGEGEPLPEIDPEPNTVQSQAKRARQPRQQRVWLMVLAGIAALGLGAGSALAVIKLWMSR
jgi:serine/threonine protein kinase